MLYFVKHVQLSNSIIYFIFPLHMSFLYIVMLCMTLFTRRHNCHVQINIIIIISGLVKLMNKEELVQ